MLIWVRSQNCGSLVTWFCYQSLQWHHNEHDNVSNHQPNECLLNCLFRSRSKKTSKLHVTGLCAGNSPVTGEFPAQLASNAENVFIWWRHHVIAKPGNKTATVSGPDPYVLVKLVIIGYGNGLVPMSTKPLPQPMMTHCQLETSGTWRTNLTKCQSHLHEKNITQQNLCQVQNFSLSKMLLFTVSQMVMILYMCILY